MPFVKYRIIKFEAETQEILDSQIEDSVSNGIYSPRPGLTISIKDRDDDPNESRFFDNLPKYKNMATEKTRKLLEKLATTVVTILKEAKEREETK